MVFYNIINIILMHWYFITPNFITITNNQTDFGPYVHIYKINIINCTKI